MSQSSNSSHGTELAEIVQDPYATERREAVGSCATGPATRLFDGTLALLPTRHRVHVRRGPSPESGDNGRA